MQFRCLVPPFSKTRDRLRVFADGTTPCGGVTLCKANFYPHKKSERFNRNESNLQGRLHNHTNHRQQQDEASYLSHTHPTGRIRAETKTRGKCDRDDDDDDDELPVITRRGSGITVGTLFKAFPSEEEQTNMS